MSAVSTRRSTGWSLVKGPVAIIGLLGVIYGVSGLISGAHGFHVHNVPHGAVYGKHWLRLEVNGWSNLLFIAAGLLLLLGSPAHWVAKSSAFIVAVALGAAAIIGVIRGNGIFGIFAADHVTEIVWGAAAIVLLLTSRLPRVGRGRRTAATAAPVTRDRAPARVDDDRIVEPVVSDRRSEPAVGDRAVVPVAHDGDEDLVAPETTGEPLVRERDSDA